MKTVPSKHWPNHHTVRIPPPGIQRDPLSPTNKLPVRIKTQLEHRFKEELLRPDSPEGSLECPIPQTPPLRVQITQYGHTALVAAIFYVAQPDVACITLCLGGIDIPEDESALRAATDFLIRADRREPLVLGINDLIVMVRSEPRPLAAHIHLDECGYDTQSIRVSTDCLAQAFFDVLGAEKIDPTGRQ